MRCHDGPFAFSGDRFASGLPVEEATLETESPASEASRCSSLAGSMLRSYALHATLPALLLCLLGARSAVADDVQSWTEVEVGVPGSDRIDWTVGGVARIRDSLGSVYDRRARTDVEFGLSDVASVTLGYILLNRAREEFGSGFGWDHRLHAALTYPLLRRGVRVEGTTLYERHIGRRDSGDFNRYRQQVELERPAARVSPWLHQSLAFERRGFVRSRSRVGIRWRLRSGHSFIGAYQFERRRSGGAWRPRHAVLSEWSLDLGTGQTAAR